MLYFYKDLLEPDFFFLYSVNYLRGEENLLKCSLISAAASRRMLTLSKGLEALDTIGIRVASSEINPFNLSLRSFSAKLR